jgi:hypothetical protein
MKSYPSRQIRARRGATAVETAIVLPVFLLIVLSMIEMAQLSMAYHLLNRAAREGCRLAVIPGNSQAYCEDQIKSILNAGGITLYNSGHGATASPICWGPNPAALGDAVTLTLSVPFKDISWLSKPLFLGSATLQASATHSSENPG